MEKINSNLDKTLAYMIYGALLILALGLVTSISILSLSHILMIIPSLYFLPKTSFKKVSKSTWALIAMTLMIILSVLVTQDIAVNGYKAISKSKYFIFGFITITPLAWYFKYHGSEKKISYLLYLLCIATTIATIAGMIGLISGFNPILMKVAHPSRNSGLFGMLMNYAHNLSYFLIIITGLVIYRNEVKKYINIKFLISVLVINLIGFYFTYTRGAWLGYLFAVPFFFLKDHKKLFISLFAGLILLGVGAYYTAGSNVIRPESEIERISQWQSATKAFQERPILGYGYLNFENYSADLKVKYDLPAKTFRGHAHSNLFEMLGSTGGLGFIAFIAWVILWTSEAYKSNTLIAKISLPFIVVFVVGGLTQSTISLGINLFFIMAAYSLSATAKSIMD